MTSTGFLNLRRWRNHTLSRARSAERTAVFVAAALTISALLQGLGPSAAHAAEPALLPLVTFFSESRGDYFTTSQPGWTCQYFGTCSADPSYRAVGLQGFIYNPANPRPAGTVALYHWWSPSRADNFLTSNPAWAGAVGDIRLSDDGYQLFRIEGYIRSTATPDSVPLTSFWNATPKDNAAVNALRTPLPAGWGSYRVEGYLVGPNTIAGRECAARAEPAYVDSPWTVGGNYINTWPAPEDFMNGDALQISATGETRIDFWGAHKSVSGEGIAGAGWPCPEAPRYALIGRVTTGRIWVPGRGWYNAGEWFPVGAGTGCLEYNAQGVTAGNLELMINDTNISDNAGGPTTVVRQYW